MHIWPHIPCSVIADGPRSSGFLPARARGPVDRSLSPEFHRVSWMLSAATRSSRASFITPESGCSAFSAMQGRMP